MKKVITQCTTALMILLGFFFVSSSKAQNQVEVPGIVSQLTLDEEGRIQCELHAHDEIAQNHHQTLGSNSTINKNKYNLKKKSGGGATIIVDYYNFDPGFANIVQARAAFQSAVDIWAQNIDSDEPIFIAAVFQPLRPNVLGSAGPTFINSNSPGLQRDTWYGNALADKLAGQDLNPGAYDIVARFSTVFTNWYFGTDGNTPANDFDFRTVVLHELGHGLGFFGSMYVDNATGIGDWGFGISSPVFPAIYDRHVYDRPGKKLIDKYNNFSTELGAVLLDDPLVFRGSNTVKVTNGEGAKVFTVLDLGENEIPGLTNVWLPGSSYSHLDYFTYTGTANGLMVPFLSRGFAYTNPGEIVNAMFADMGWNGKVQKPYVDNARLAMDDEGSESVSSITLYPNHVQDRFVVDLGNKRNTLRGVKMVDFLGRTYQVNYANIDTQHIGFDLSSSQMKSGVYILQLHFDNQRSETLRISKVQ
jgi:hypothetical protein